MVNIERIKEKFVKAEPRKPREVSLRKEMDEIMEELRYHEGDEKNLSAWNWYKLFSRLGNLGIKLNELKELDQEEAIRLNETLDRLTADYRAKLGAYVEYKKKVPGFDNEDPQMVSLLRDVYDASRKLREFLKEKLGSLDIFL